DLSDLAVAAVCIAALASRGRIERAARTGLFVVAAFAVAAVLSTAWGAHFHGYDLHAHVISAGKGIGGMLLAPAGGLAPRRPADLVPAAFAAVGWSFVVTAIGFLQYVGALGDLEHTPAGRRKSSLLGYHDFSAMSASVLALALIVLATRRGP